MKIKVFTLAYQPFRLGGDLHTPISCEVEVTGPYKLGLGYEGYLVTAPNGSTFVAESTTGAFVGPTIREVRQDIEAGDPKLMKAQVKSAKGLAARAEPTSANRFWSMLRCS